MTPFMLAYNPLNAIRFRKCSEIPGECAQCLAGYGCDEGACEKTLPRMSSRVAAALKFMA